MVLPCVAGRRSTLPFHPATLIPPYLPLRSASYAWATPATSDAAATNTRIRTFSLRMRLISRKLRVGQDRRTQAFPWTFERRRAPHRRARSPRLTEPHVSTQPPRDGTRVR